MGANVLLSGPPTLMPWPLTPAGWGAGQSQDPGYGQDPGQGQGSNQRNGAAANPLSAVSIQPDLDIAIAGADLVIALRIQLERQERGFFPSLREYIRRWQVNDARMALARPNALLMHPGPMNEGVEVSPRLAHGERSLIEEQVTNGVAVRMALLYQTVAAGASGAGDE